MSAAYNTDTVEHDVFSSAHEQAEAMEQQLRSDDAMGSTHSELEVYVRREGREYERRLLQAHLELRASRERPVEARGADGVVRGFRRESHRPLGTIFGSVVVLRLAYQAPGVAGLHPMDASLNLPDELYSHGVRRLVAEGAARCSYDEVVESVAATTGTTVHKRQIEQLAIRAAQDFEAFYATRTVEAEDTDHLLVLTFDGKGIIMRPDDLRPATRRAAALATHKLTSRLTKGEKRNRKRMAEVAAIYSVAPFSRTPMDVLHDLKPTRDVAIPRPRPVNKRVSASVVFDAKTVIKMTFDEALRRDPERHRRWIVLVDGNRDQIAMIRKAAKQHDVEPTLVLDLMHVLEYLWTAAYCFHDEGSKDAQAWVEHRLLALLLGQSAGAMAKSMRRSAKLRGLHTADRKGVDDCARYLVNNRKLLHYDRALRDGLPVGTGVIEGACRYLVKDRMDRTGARWSLRGAEAVLRLRALWTNGDFNDYWAFHLECEHRRTHRARYAGERVPSPVPRSKTCLRRVK
ncbi:MAG TPA: ISKra4 family transposase [Steroidobacteraceae bacterium]